VPISQSWFGRPAWRVRRAERGRPFYCALLSGAARLELDGRQPVALQAGDFVLIPDAQEFAMTVEGIAPDETVEMFPVRQADGSFRLGPPDGLLGYVSRRLLPVRLARRGAAPVAPASVRAGTR
jgi:hypothetical protein